MAHIVYQKPGGEVIAAINDNIVALQQVPDIVRTHFHRVRHDLDLRIDPLQCLHRRFNLGPSHISGAMEYLPLQVVQRHLVVVHQTECAHPGSGQVKGRRRAQPTSPQHQHPGRIQGQLATFADLVQGDMAGVAVIPLQGAVYFSGGDNHPSLRRWPR